MADVDQLALWYTKDLSKPYFLERKKTMSTKKITLKWHEVSHIAWVLGLQQGDCDVNNLNMWNYYPGLKFTPTTSHEEVCTSLIWAFSENSPDFAKVEDRNRLRETFTKAMAYQIEKRLGE
jgi:hypothetical protein